MVGLPVGVYQWTFAQWTLNDYGALIGIILGIGTFPG